MDRKLDDKELKKIRRKRLFWAVSVVAAIIIMVTVPVGLLGRKSIRQSELVFSQAETGPLETTVAASGRVVPAMEEIVNSPVSSRIIAVYAQPGDSVKAGTPLLQLDLQEAEATSQNLRDSYLVSANNLQQLRLANRNALADMEMRIKIKEMEVNRMKIEVENERRLDSLGSGTGDRVRQARTTLSTGQLELQGLMQNLVNERERLASVEEAARLELNKSARDLEMMERTLARGQIPAPLDGVLTYLNNSIGSMVAVGEKVAVVGNLSRFKIDAEVAEGSSFKVKPGAAVMIRFGTDELSGTVANVEPQSTSGAVPFTVALDDASNRHLRPGLRVQVYVAYGYKDKVTRIAAGSYYTSPGSYNLFVRDGSKLERRRVRLGDCNSQWVEVIEGVSPGESVVISDMEKYKSHSSLKIKK